MYGVEAMKEYPRIVILWNTPGKYTEYKKAP
jgi:hypothetical protein